jgi:hypothetical protein
MPFIHDNLTIVEVDDPMILLEAGRDKAFQRALVAHLSDRCVVIHEDRVGAVVKLFDKLGHHPKVV